MAPPSVGYRLLMGLPLRVAGAGVAALATLSLFAAVSVNLLPIAILVFGGYFSARWLSTERPTAAPQSGSVPAAPSTVKGWITAKVEQKLRAWMRLQGSDQYHILAGDNNIAGGYVLALREGDEEPGSAYTKADASAAVEAFARAFRGAFAATQSPVRVETAGRFLRFSPLAEPPHGSPAAENPKGAAAASAAGAMRELLATIKAAEAAPGYTPRARGLPPIVDRIYAAGMRSERGAPPLIEHGFPLHAHVPMLLHVDAARLKALKDYYGESIAFYFEFMVFCATELPTHSLLRIRLC